MTSVEGKAIGTGAILAEVWGVPVHAAPGLHEHDRSEVGFLDPDAFHEKIAQLFAAPGARTFGAESADAARLRLERALDALRGAFPRERLAVVTHGTVLALLLAHASGAAGFALWRTLAMPDGFVVDAATYAVRERLSP